MLEHINRKYHANHAKTITDCWTWSVFGDAYASRPIG